MMRKKEKDKLSGGLLISVVVLGGIGYWLGNRQKEAETKPAPTEAVCICVDGHDPNCLACKAHGE
jgi:hypothetical protein